MREPRFDLVHVREGRVSFDHYGCRFDVHAGQCVLIDSSQTYSFLTSELSSSTSLQIPQKWLRTLIPTPEDGVASIIGGEMPWGNALLATLNALTPDSLATLVIPGGILAEQVAALLARAIGRRASALVSSQQKLLQRVRETLSAMAHNALVNPQSVADAHGISKRYLHLLFGRAGTTFGHELMEIRLQRSRRLLDDPGFRQLSVSEIAWCCGFGDPSHFARRFRVRFGKPPTQYRQARATAR